MLQRRADSVNLQMFLECSTSVHSCFFPAQPLVMAVIFAGNQLLPCASADSGRNRPVPQSDFELWTLFSS